VPVSETGRRSGDRRQKWRSLEVGRVSSPGTTRSTVSFRFCTREFGPICSTGATLQRAAPVGASHLWQRNGFSGRHCAAWVAAVLLGSPGGIGHVNNRAVASTGCHGLLVCSGRPDICHRQSDFWTLPRSASLLETRRDPRLPPSQRIPTGTCLASEHRFPVAALNGRPGRPPPCCCWSDVSPRDSSGLHVLIWGLCS
jgi:hypothetical protein